MNWIKALLSPVQKAALRREIEVKSRGVPVTFLPSRYATGAKEELAMDYELEVEE